MSEERRMTLGEHLEELRLCVLKALGWVFLALLFSLLVQDRLMRLATWPHQRVVTSLAAEARTGYAADRLDGQLVERLAEANEVDEGLAARLEEVERGGAVLRARARPSLEGAEGLLAAQRDLLERLAALRARQEALEAGDPPGDEAVRAIEAERVALAAEAEALRARVKAEVAPFLDRRARVPRFELIQLRYQEGFLAFLKVSIISALFIASPLVAYQLWQFVAAGLYPDERRYIYYFAPLTFGAFATGVLFGYFVLIPLGLRFLATYAPPELVAGQFSLSDYLSLFIGLTLVTGLIFEVPLIMGFLSLVGVVSPERYRQIRRYWILAAFVIGAILTPPDPVTQTLMAIPLLLLYEVGIVFSQAITRRQRAREEERAREEAETAAREAAAAAAVPAPEPEPAPRLVPAAGTVARSEGALPAAIHLDGALEDAPRGGEEFVEPADPPDLPDPPAPPAGEQRPT